MKFLIAGLGNIGDRYHHTRHNIGFDVLDTWAHDDEFQFTEKKRAFVARHRYHGKSLVLIKPTTFMNLSGKAVSYWMQQEKIPLENLLVVIDDLALPTGKIRLKASGSTGGHNGLRHITETLGTSSYARLRFGVGNDFPKGRQADYVLSPWEEQEYDWVKKQKNTAIEVIKSFVGIGIQHAMNQFNNKT